MGSRWVTENTKYFYSSEDFERKKVEKKKSRIEEDTVEEEEISKSGQCLSLFGWNIFWEWIMTIKCGKTQSCLGNFEPAYIDTRALRFLLRIPEVSGSIFCFFNHPFSASYFLLSKKGKLLN
ncbi:hypothetical protein CEXT_419921 [Caerostris extrusa]|uniref:Uncharacterized protein n=1 Tax=Caerostris extrusa TaxID=172846 RepID=A0AAV4SG76_CAEEX|nr:hypothetical protein CEXT_419921 [Caerostris extrusa]